MFSERFPQASADPEDAQNVVQAADHASPENPGFSDSGPVLTNLTPVRWSDPFFFCQFSYEISS
jgi:hypothetical protein